MAISAPDFGAYSGGPIKALDSSGAQDYLGSIGGKLSAGWGNLTGRKDEQQAQAARQQLGQNIDTQAQQLGGVASQMQSQGAGALAQIGEVQNRYRAQRDQAMSQYQQARSPIDTMATQADWNLANSTTGIEKDYEDQLNKLSTQSADQASNAQRTYQNSIQPQFKDLMEQSAANAQNAMSLNNAMNPMNNAVSQQVQGGYNQLGNQLQGAYNQTGANLQGMYGQGSQQALSQSDQLYNQYAGDITQQTQGIRQQGLADYGVLSALGAQATQGQMGTGMPMTAGQQQLMQAQNQQQASQAFGNTQRRIQALEDQRRQQNLQFGLSQVDKANQYRQMGLSANEAMQRAGQDVSSQMRQQGLQSGMGQSNLAYQQGLQAQQQAGQAAQNAQNAQGLNLSQQGNLRGEQSGFAQGIQQSRQNAANTKYNTDWNIIQRQYGNLSEDTKNQLSTAASNANMDVNTFMSALQNAQQGESMQAQILSNQMAAKNSLLGGDIAAANAAAQGKQAMIGGIAGMAGTIGGGMYGGPMGAAIAGGAAQNLGNGLSANAPVGNPYQTSYGSPYASQGVNAQMGGGGINPILFQRDTNGNFMYGNPGQQQQNRVLVPMEPGQV